MKRTIIYTLFLLSFVCQQANATHIVQNQYDSSLNQSEHMSWWTHDRFGLFIHWGLYAMPARHEWVKSREKMSDEHYNRYKNLFNPDLYNPEEWAYMAKAAGVKYMVFTTKHHDGFCMWDSKYTDYKITNTPYKKDVLKPLVNAFRNEGIRIGFYYSLLDWHHPDFTIDRNHPQMPQNPDLLKELNKNRNMAKYREYMKNQLTELLTEFGQIDELFMDYTYAEGENGKNSKDWDAEGIVKLARKLQPQIIINNRLGLTENRQGWDYITPEQFMPQQWPTVNSQRVPWETCQTFSGSWGYHRDEYSWKSVHQIIVMLAETVSKGGNLLLNVGPTARGVFDERAIERLNGLAHWMRFHSSAIYGCTAAPTEYACPNNCILTYNPNTNRLYIHVLEWPFKSLYLKQYKGKIQYAQLLNDNSELKFRTETKKGSHMTENTGADDVIITLPVERPNVELPVIELILE